MTLQAKPRTARAASGLRLRAEDAEDLAVISACLQDALVPVRDLAYDRSAQIFMTVANRFRWEANHGSDRRFERTLCALTFDRVESVTYRGFSRAEEDRILSLLAIRLANEASSQTIDLEFADGATIRLVASGVHCRLRDLGEPWPTVWQPGHALDEQK